MIIDVIIVRTISAVLFLLGIASGNQMDRPGPDYEGRSRASIENRPKAVQVRLQWQLDDEISWYGPGFYGHRTACGLPLTHQLVGVAHRSLPCGTLIEFRWKNKTVITPVVDRGPYVQGRQFDLTGGACQALDHCFTGPIEWRRIDGN